MILFESHARGETALLQMALQYFLFQFSNTVIIGKPGNSPRMSRNCFSEVVYPLSVRQVRLLNFTENIPWRVM